LPPIATDHRRSLLGHPFCHHPPLRANTNHDGSPSSSSTADASATTNPRLSRRQVGELSVAAAGLGISYLSTCENMPQDYGLWGVLPVGTYKRKKTVMEMIVPVPCGHSIRSSGYSMCRCRCE
jgi:hypothetical protein